MRVAGNRIDFWGDGMRIFLDYIARQTSKNPEYNPHPLIKALELALYKIRDVDDEQSVIGISQDGAGENVQNQFAVVMQKHKDGDIEVKEIRSLQVDKELPLDVMIIIFRMQILLDKIPGDTVSPKQVTDCLNNVIPGEYFYFLGDRWREAVDIFRGETEGGRISLPRTPEMKKIVKELSGITHDTSWEDYSPGARSLIGSFIKQKMKDSAAAVIITTPNNFKIQKYKVFDMATEFMLGKSSEYLNLLDKHSPDDGKSGGVSKKKS